MPSKTGSQPLFRTILIIGLGWGLSAIWWAAAGQWQFLSFQKHHHRSGWFPPGIGSYRHSFTTKLSRTNPKKRKSEIHSDPGLAHFPLSTDHPSVAVF